jgi:hypothetical protein
MGMDVYGRNNESMSTFRSTVKVCCYRTCDMDVTWGNDMDVTSPRACAPLTELVTSMSASPFFALSPSASFMAASRLSSTPKRERVVVQPGGDARWLCSKARRLCHVDNNGVLVHEEVSTPVAPQGATTAASGGSSPTLPTLALLSPEVPLLATSTPVPQPGILVAENSLGLVAAEVVQPEVVVAQRCQSFLPYNSSGRADSSCPSVVVADPPVAWPPVAQLLIPRSLREIFTMHVMCDFTPRAPKDFPTARWATLEQLVLQLQPHAPAEVARIGAQNLRQLITEWYKGHPTFAGLAYSAWGKRLKDMHPLAHPRSLTYKFSFEYTPGAMGGPYS